MQSWLTIVSLFPFNSLRSGVDIPHPPQEPHPAIFFSLASLSTHTRIYQLPSPESQALKGKGGPPFFSGLSRPLSYRAPMSPGPDTPGAGAGQVQSPAPVGDDGAGGGGGGAKRDAEAVGSPAAGDNGGARKKKKTGPGSRGVANLTPEQLAKKRANGEFCSH